MLQQNIRERQQQKQKKAIKNEFKRMLGLENLWMYSFFTPPFLYKFLLCSNRSLFKCEILFFIFLKYCTTTKATTTAFIGIKG